MEWSPKLDRQTSCACLAMDITAGWCNNRRRTTGFSRWFADIDFDDELDSSEYYPTARWSSRWRGLWRMILGEKRRILNSAASMQATYDPYTYAQNFDDGAALGEPENLSRSFSARFAGTSKMIRRLP